MKYLCDSGNGYFPGANLTPDDVIATWAGLRPLIAAPPNVDESEISREHEVFTKNDGLVIIAGGKLTTYRRMAREAVNKTLELLRELGETVDAKHENTKTRPLPGAGGHRSADLEGVAAIGRRLMDEYGLDVDTATHLCGVYGSRALELGATIAADRALGERHRSRAAVRVGRGRLRGEARSRAHRRGRARPPRAAAARRRAIRGSACASASRRAWRRFSAGMAATTTQMLDEYKAEVALSRRWRA